MRNIMSPKCRIFFHRNSRFHYSLFLRFCDDFNAQQGRKELIQNRSIGAKRLRGFSFAGILFFIKNLKNDFAAFLYFLQR